MTDISGMMNLNSIQRRKASQTVHGLNLFVRFRVGNQRGLFKDSKNPNPELQKSQVGYSDLKKKKIIQIVHLREGLSS